jgi:hypothetical protein
MSELDSARVAERLGLTDAVIRQLRARGYLQRLALGDDEIRDRLYRGQLAYIRARTDVLPPLSGRGRARDGSEPRAAS